MNPSTLEAALRAADPITGNAITGTTAPPPVSRTVADARRRAAELTRTRRRRVRHRIAFGAIAAGLAAAVVVAVPVIFSDHAPRADAIHLVAFRPPASVTLPFGVATAPGGWHVAATKGTGDSGSVVTLAPQGQGPTADEAITIVRYALVQRDFPQGYEGQGPVTRTTSNGRAVTTMHGTTRWFAQLELRGGGAFVVQAPLQMTGGQVQAFVDGLSARGR